MCARDFPFFPMFQFFTFFFSSVFSTSSYNLFILYQFLVSVSVCVCPFSRFTHSTWFTQNSLQPRLLRVASPPYNMFQGCISLKVTQTLSSGDRFSYHPNSLLAYLLYWRAVLEAPPAYLVCHSSQPTAHASWRVELLLQYVLGV